MVKMQAIGHLGKDASVNNRDGQVVINFSIASTEKWKDANGEIKEKTTWTECSYWPKSDAIAQYLKKGTQVYVEGTPAARAWTPRDGGDPQASLTLRILQVKLLSGNNPSGGSTGQAAASQNEAQQGSAAPSRKQDVQDAIPAGGPDDDLPF